NKRTARRGRRAEKHSVGQDAASPTTEPTKQEILPPRSAKDWAEGINTAWRVGVAWSIETGHPVIEGRAALPRRAWRAGAHKAARPHGQWLPMINKRLLFSPTVAVRLMKIAAHPVLSNVTHGSHLPASWTTLYVLSHVEPERLETLIEDKTVNPSMERADAER